MPLLPPRIGVERADPAAVRQVRAEEEAAYLVFGMRPNPEVGRIDSEVPKALGLELQLIDDERVADAKVEPSHGGDAWCRNIRIREVN